MRTNAQKTKASAKAKPVGSSRYSTPRFSHSVLQLQQQLGNHTVQCLLDCKRIQANLTIGQPDGKYEQEADLIADQVMRMPDSTATDQSQLELSTQKPDIQRLYPHTSAKTFSINERSPSPIVTPIMSAVLQRQSKPEKKTQTWIPDRGGDLWFDTEPEARWRMRHHPEKDNWSEMQIGEVKIKGKIKYRVEMRGRITTGKTEKTTKTAKGPKKTPSRPESWQADSNVFEKRADAEKRMQELMQPENRDWKSYRVGKVPEKKEEKEEKKAKAERQEKTEKKVQWRVEMRSRLKPGTKTFALTFDDGPHTAEPGGGGNYTEMVLNTLNKKGLKGKAAFFVQALAPHRGGNKIGVELIKRMLAEGYEVGIHTGGKGKHESHVKSYKEKRLEPELTQAKEHIEKLAPEEKEKEKEKYKVKWVRAVGGARGAGSTRKGIHEIYKRLKLIHLLWDIDGDKGSHNHPLSKLKSLFDEGLKVLPMGARGTYHPAPWNKASKHIVTLYHDVREGTAKHLGGMIDYIGKKVRGARFEKP